MYRCSLGSYSPISIMGVPAINDGCRFGHHLQQRASDLSKTQLIVQLI